MSDCHKMAVTVLKTTSAKTKPKLITYRNYKNFDNGKLKDFEKKFLQVLETDAPSKNNAPYMKTIKESHDDMIRIKRLIRQ